MADNVTLPAAGEVVATDDAGAAGQVQIVKLAVSTNGSASAIPADASGLLVNLGTGSAQAQDAVYSPGSLAMVGGVRRDGDTSPVSADGDVHPMTFNSIGRLKVSAMPGIYTATTGNITANAQTVVCDVSRASNVMMHMVATSLVGHNVTFEGSIDGGTTWFGIQVVRTNANTIETTTGVLAATPAYAWEASVNAYTNVRVRATAHTSGTAAWRILPGAYATEPIPAAQATATQPISGSLTSAGTTTNTPATPTVTNAIINSAATTNGTVVKATAGTIFGVVASNQTATAKFLKLHNSATVTAGTTAVALTIPIPASSVVALDFGPMGMRYGTGICLSITNLVADNDTTAIAVGDVKVNLAYI